MAGAGQGTLLTRITDGLREVYGEEAVLVIASTAVAASHIDGVTLHSAVGAGHGPMGGDLLIQQCGRRQGLLDRLLSTRALVIDEISQVSSVTFNAVQRLFQLVKGNSLPMGGVQLVTCGDFLQLPPVTPTGYCGSRVPLAFESGAWAPPPLSSATSPLCSVRATGSRTSAIVSRAFVTATWTAGSSAIS